MYAALGDGPGNSLLAGRCFPWIPQELPLTLSAGLAIVIGIPFPIYLYFRGEQLRQRSKY